MDKVSHSLVILAVAALTSVASGRLCPRQHYLDHGGQECRPCSLCPINEIIRKPCTRHKDTVCGPFYEFEFNNQEALSEDQQKFMDDKFIQELGLELMNWPTDDDGMDNEDLNNVTSES